MNLEEKEVENRFIRCVGCVYWDWNRYHSIEELEVVNASQRRATVEYYNLTCRDIIARHHAEDIKMFGFGEFD